LLAQLLEQHEKDNVVKGCLNVVNIVHFIQCSENIIFQAKHLYRYSGVSLEKYRLENKKNMNKKMHLFIYTNFLWACIFLVLPRNSFKKNISSKTLSPLQRFRGKMLEK